MTNRLLNISFVTNIVVAILLIGALVEIQEFSSSVGFVPGLFAWATLALVAVDMIRQVIAVTPDPDAEVPGRDEVVAKRNAKAARTELLRVVFFVLAFWIAVFFLGFHGAPFLLVGCVSDIRSQGQMAYSVRRGLDCQYRYRLGNEWHRRERLDRNISNDSVRRSWRGNWPVF